MIDKLRTLGETSNTERITLRRADTGQGLTGLDNSSSGLIISTICDNEAAATAYAVASSKVETISTLATYAAPTATKCRFKEVDATNHPGLYEVQLADARYAVSGAKMLRITISGATNLLQKEYKVGLNVPVFNPFAARTIYVSSAGTSAGPGTLSAPYDTITHAVSAANPGDIVHLVGSITETLSISKRVILEGDSKLASVVTSNSSSATLTLSNVGGFVLRNIKIVNTNANGQGINVSNLFPCPNLTIEHTDVVGNLDGVFATGQQGLTIRDCVITGTADGVMVKGTQGLLIENCKCFTDGSFNTDIARGLIIDNCSGRVVSTVCMATRTNAATAVTMGLQLGYDSSDLTLKRGVSLTNVDVQVSRVNVSATGQVIGVGTDTNSTFYMAADWTGGSVRVSSPVGTGNLYEIDASTSNSKLNIRGVSYTRANCNQTNVSNIVDTPTTGVTLADGSIKGSTFNGTSAVAQTGDAFTRLGAPAGASHAADIAAIQTKLGSPAHTSIAGDIANVSSGSGDGFSDTERAQILTALSVPSDIGVPKNLIWVIDSKDGQVRPNAHVTKTASAKLDVAADFRKLFAAGDAIKNDGTGIVAVTLVTAGSGLPTSPAFSDPTQATVWMSSAGEFHVEGGMDGQSYTIRVKILTVKGNTYSADCVLDVKGS